MKRVKNNTPERIWTQERMNMLTDLFVKGLSDKDIADEINKRDGSSYSDTHIIQQRSAMGIMRAKGRSTRSSTRTKAKDLKRANRKKDTLSDISLKTSFKKNEKVYLPGVGLCLYGGITRLAEGSEAANVDLHVFHHIKDSKKKTVMIPKDKIESKKIRPLMTEDQWREVEKTLRSAPKPVTFRSGVPTTLNERVMSADFRLVAEVVRDVAAYKEKVSAEIGDITRNRYEQAMTMLSMEYAAVKGIEQKEAEQAIEKIVEANKRMRAKHASPEIA